MPGLQGSIVGLRGPFQAQEGPSMGREGPMESKVGENDWFSFFRRGPLEQAALS